MAQKPSLVPIPIHGRPKRIILNWVGDSVMDYPDQGLPP